MATETDKYPNKKKNLFCKFTTMYHIHVFTSCILGWFILTKLANSRFICIYKKTMSFIYLPTYLIH